MQRLLVCCSSQPAPGGRKSSHETQQKVWKARYKVGKLPRELIIGIVNIYRGIDAPRGGAVVS